MQKNLLIDYLVMSFKCTDMLQAGCFLRWLYKYLNFPVEKAQQIRSYYGLKNCYFYIGIKIHYDMDLVILDCSGKGCRTLEKLNKNFDWFNFLHIFHKPLTEKWGSTNVYQCKISRLDVACDLLNDDKITINKLQNYVLKEKVICKAKYHTCIIGNEENAIYFGSPRSDRRLRIYDKALEQGLQGKTDWMRFEFQLRNDNALSYYLNWCNYKSISNTYYGVMRDFLRFITKPNDGINQNRKQTCKWWLKFLEDVKAIKQLYLPADNYDIYTLKKYLSVQCSSSMRAYVEANEGDITDLLDMIDKAELNKKQVEMLKNLEIINKNVVEVDTSKPPALTPKQALILGAALSEQNHKNDEEIVKHWHWNSVEEQKAYENAQKIKSELAANDLPF